MLPGLYNPALASQVTLVSYELDQDWGRVGDDPAPYTLTNDPAKNQLLIVGGHTYESTQGSGPRSSETEIDGGNAVFNTRDYDSQGFNDDIVGGGMARDDGPLTNPVVTMVCPDTTSGVNRYGLGAVILNNASRTLIDSDGSAQDGPAYSITVNVVAGGYVFAYFMARNIASITWSGVTSIASAASGTNYHGIAGKEIGADGTLTVQVTNTTNQGYLGVVSVGPL